jgi:YesN/AraC family two-component response regulator
MKVVLADDSDLILKRLQDLISDYDQVELIGSCNNGADALDVLKTLKPDLAILDIKMPGYTGLEVLHEIRKENKNIQIIILTLYTNFFYRKLAMEEGANYFFSKAADFEKIPMVIEEMLLLESIGMENPNIENPAFPKTNTTNNHTT